MIKGVNRKKVAFITVLILIVNIFMPVIIVANNVTTISMEITTPEQEYYNAGDQFTLAINISDLIEDGSVAVGVLHFDGDKLGLKTKKNGTAIVNYDGATSNDNFAGTDEDSLGSLAMCSWSAFSSDAEPRDTSNEIVFAVKSLSVDDGTDGQMFRLYFNVKEGATGTATFTLTNLKYSNSDNPGIENHTVEETYYDVNGEGSSLTINVGQPPVPLESIAISPNSVDLSVGETQQFSIERTPANTTDLRNPAWTTSNGNVATVDDGGLVTAIGPGSATITATIGDEEYSSSGIVNVSAHLTGITVAPTGTVNLITNVNENKTQQITVTNVPNPTTDTVSYTYTSSDTEVATVSDSGLITAVANGTANITVNAFVDGEQEPAATATVPVKVITAIESISIGESESGTMIKGESKTLNLTITPATASVDEVVWAVSDDTKLSITTQSNSSCEFEAIGASGNASVTVSVTDETGSDPFTKTYSVVLSNPLQSISFDGVGETLHMEPGTRDLTIVYNPADASDIVDAVWTSNNTDVATVENGTVTAIKPGEATITATVGEISTSVVITVDPVPLNSIVLNKETTTIVKTQTETLTYVINPENTTDPTDVIWVSSDPTVATVEDGVVTALKKGTTTITVKIDGNETINDSCEVTVVVPLTGFTLSDSEITLKRGVNGQDTKTVTVTLNEPDTSDDTTVTWTSGNTSVATVDQNGKITAVAGGQAVITAQIGEFTETVNVTVEVPLQSISIKSATSLIKKQTETLTVTYDPSDTTDSKAVTWTSSDPTVATVDSTGKITAIKAGTTTITATVGEFSDTCAVTVTEKNLTGITISNTKDTILKNEVLALEYLFDPEDTTDEITVAWSSSDDSIATVDSDGNVTGVKAGTVTIKVTATVTNTQLHGHGLLGATAGVFEDEVDIEVQEIHIDSIEASTDNEDNKVTMGNKLKIKTKFTPENTTDSKELIYTSSDETIARVDEEGNIIPVAPGTVSITVMAANGVKSQITVTVEAAPEAEAEEAATDSPKTGDINIALYSSLMIISLLGLIIQKKKNK